METQTLGPKTTENKVKAVQPTGTYDSAYGTLFKFEYQMEDDTVLSANHKSQDGFFKVGEPIEYLVKGKNANGNYGSVSKPNLNQNSGQSPVVKKGGNASFALSYAKDLVAAGKIDIKQILETAERFDNWLNTRS